MTAPVTAGVTGWPIAHSLSPLIHGAWIAASGLNARYDAFPAPEEADFDALIDRLRAGELRGLNVTAPWKARALASADTASDLARRAGSANLLVARDGRIHADSTDGEGVIRALAEQAPGLRLSERTTVVLGAGGAARAAAAALVDAGARVLIVNRSRDRAEALAADLGPGVAVAEDAAEALGRAALAVNALSVRPDIDLGLVPTGAAVLDMTYRPLVTPFLEQAKAHGLVPVDGLAMLIGQARPSFAALFETPAPDIDVRALAEAALKGDGS